MKFIKALFFLFTFSIPFFMRAQTPVVSIREVELSEGQGNSSERFIYTSTFDAQLKKQGPFSVMYIKSEDSILVARGQYSGGHLSGICYWKTTSGNPLLQASFTAATGLSKPVRLIYGDLMITDTGVFNGDVIDYYTGASLANAQKTLTQFRNGQREGVFKEWYENGTRKTECFFKNDTLNGSYKEYYPNGTIYIECFFTDNCYDSTYKEYYANGKIKVTDTYRNAALQYREAYYDQPYRLYVKGFYTNGRLDSMFTYNEYGRFETECRLDSAGNGYKKEYFRNGSLHRYKVYKNYKLNGECIEYHTNGEMSKKQTYVDEEIEGVVTEWDKNGILEKESMYKNGIQEGLCKTYQNGYPESECYYVNGQIDGVCKEFYPDGKLKLKEVYREGSLLSSVKYDPKGKIIKYPEETVAATESLGELIDVGARGDLGETGSAGYGGESAYGQLRKPAISSVRLGTIDDSLHAVWRQKKPALAMDSLNRLFEAYVLSDKGSSLKKIKRSLDIHFTVSGEYINETRTVITVRNFTIESNVSKAQQQALTDFFSSVTLSFPADQFLDVESITYYLAINKPSL